MILDNDANVITLGQREYRLTLPITPPAIKGRPRFACTPLQAVMHGACRRLSRATRPRRRRPRRRCATPAAGPSAGGRPVCAPPGRAVGHADVELANSGHAAAPPSATAAATSAKSLPPRSTCSTPPGRRCGGGLRHLRGQVCENGTATPPRWGCCRSCRRPTGTPRVVGSATLVLDDVLSPERHRRIAELTTKPSREAVARRSCWGGVVFRSLILKRTRVALNNWKSAPE